jgi:Coenzyme PQQ synthesis protein D (PqqD)
LDLQGDGIVWREVDDEVLILEMESGTYLNLNGAARLLWLALTDAVSVAGLGSHLVDTFGISSIQADADVRQFLADLSSRSLVERVA